MLLFLVLINLTLCVLSRETDEWAVQFKGDINITSFLQKHNYFEYVGKIGTLPNSHTFRFSPGNKRGILDYDVNCLLQSQQDGDFSERIVWSQRQELFKVAKRGDTLSYLPYKDPLLPTQWHLHNFTEPSKHIHLNVVPVWQMGITGKESVIAIVDDGIQHIHPDLSPNWKSGVGNWNYNLLSSDIRPKDMTKDWHGTACAGLAVAFPNNAVCGVGVAPGARFTAVVLLQSDLTHTDALAAQVLEHEYNVNHIYSNSWGPIDDGLRKEGPGYLTQQAMRQAIEHGRQGLGSIYVWAAGNGLKSKDNCNYDGYANSRYTATFGAVDSQGTATDYSEPCSALLGVLPSGSSRNKMQTTNLLVSYEVSTPTGAAKSCNTNFAGTSAAAPLAAGIAALVLEANRNLTWLDFQYIMQLSATRNDPEHFSWKRNGIGLWVSHSYGFGIPDAYESVMLARIWEKSIQETNYSFSVNPNLPLETGTYPDITNVVTSHIIVDKALTLHHVEVTVTIRHPCRGALDIRLISPAGTESILAEKHDDTQPNYDRWLFTTLLTWGENSLGNWSLIINDKLTSKRGDVRRLTSWDLSIYGIENITEYHQLLSFSRKIDKQNPKQTDSTSSEYEGMYFNRSWKIAIMGSVIIAITLVVSIIVIFVRKRASYEYNQIEMVAVE